MRDPAGPGLADHDAVEMDVAILAEDDRLGVRGGRVAAPQANIDLHPAHGLLRRRSQGGPGLAVEDIQGALNLLLADHGHLGLDRGRLQLGVAQELLDVADVGA